MHVCAHDQSGAIELLTKISGFEGARWASSWLMHHFIISAANPRGSHLVFLFKSNWSNRLRKWCLLVECGSGQLHIDAALRCGFLPQPTAQQWNVDDALAGWWMMIELFLMIYISLFPRYILVCWEQIVVTGGRFWLHLIDRRQQQWAVYRCLKNEDRLLPRSSDHQGEKQKGRGLNLPLGLLEIQTKSRRDSIIHMKNEAGNLSEFLSPTAFSSKYARRTSLSSECAAFGIMSCTMKCCNKGKINTRQERNAFP